MPYRAPVSEIQFLLEHVIDFAGIAATDRFAEATPDTVAAILGEAGRLCDEVLAPLQRVGDIERARLENGVVRTPTGYGDGYRAVAEGGWIGIAADPEHGGMGLPLTLASGVNDMMAGACLSLQLGPLMSQGAIEALSHHAAPELQALYLPRLVSGEWCGTMNLTEPQAGSDVGALRTRAEPADDGTYRITGEKIYITWADNDFTENVCHLVLARLPDAAPGSKGISLFLVPKRLPDADGRPGAANALRVVSLEHKLGLHGSPTAVMAYEGATSWLVGPPHGGLAAMFTMMNNARLGVGLQGIGVAEAALQLALGHASERRQGRAGGEGTIIEHADVRRMLAQMKAETFAARAIALDCARAIDMETATGAPEWSARAALLTPVAKAFGTDTGFDVASTGVQVHGGMGFIEETGAAQYLRDVRVTSIYEGTNGIQAMDLVGRKLADGGAAMLALIDEVAEAARGAELSELAAPVAQAAEALRGATEALVAAPPEARFAGAVPYLRAVARVLGGHYHLRAARSGVPARVKLARFYVARLLPEHAALLAGIGDADAVLDLAPEELRA
ncbi:probable acyl-CoA dehydrogenase [Oceanicola granulosus HTCC2516]|uniref:3-methylmercaptopropionyl-CoA dehydrogenase n=1 Tax=Oceanicola granulosus (strain ATCC BAA-861 / DSM 15982 / KCTC 12143 / HTCC2516) TaxID=314256 RepID=Q2CCE9_OCEGH|nr:acyl-CoA dehydrogenase [Oceanicola granulosus]EAR50369.1 probable acyl-CoA dehydrogenase [Oceanicola granulosus HTCC2516]